MGILGKPANNIDNLNDLYPHGIAFDVYIQRLTDSNGQEIPNAINTEPYYFLQRFTMTGKSPNGIKRGFKIKPKFGRYAVVLDPVTALPFNQSRTTIDGLVLDSTAANNVYLIDDSGGYVTLDTGVSLNGSNVLIEYEGNTTPFDHTELAKYIDYDVRKRTVSSEQGPPCKIATVNEVVNPSDVNGNTNYRGYALVGYTFKASERLTAAPNATVVIDSGRIIRQNLVAGVAGATSGTTLADPTKSFFNLGLLVNPTDGTMLRNLDTRQEALVATVTPTTISTQTALTWTPGDRYLVYNLGSSNYFPDIFVDTLINTRGGLGGIVDSDRFIDYELICAARAFVVAKGYFWDGVISESIPWSQWANKEAMSSLLHPTRIDGRFGLVPESYAAPTGVFNASNILAGDGGNSSLEEEYVPWTEQAVNRVVATFTDGVDGRFYPKTIIAMTLAAYNGTEPIVEETLDLKAVTKKSQVVDVVRVYLQSKRLQSKVVKFRTATHALYIRAGDLIVLQHPMGEYDYEVSGYVTNVVTIGTGVQQVYLSKPINSNLGDGYTASIWYTSTGNAQNSIAAELAQDADGVNTLLLSGLQETVAIGDFITVGLDATNDSLFRVSQLEFSGSGEASLTALLWPPAILGSDGVLVLDADGTVITS